MASPACGCRQQIDVVHACGRLRPEYLPAQRCQHVGRLATAEATVDLARTSLDHLTMNGTNDQIRQAHADYQQAHNTLQTVFANASRAGCPSVGDSHYFTRSTVVQLNHVCMQNNCAGPGH